MSYHDDLKRAVRHENALKGGLLARLARYGFALDAAELSAEELAVAVLKKLGLRVPDDPISALSSWLDGADAGARARDRGVSVREDVMAPGRGVGVRPDVMAPGPGVSVRPEAMDAGETFIDRYLRS